MRHSGTWQSIWDDRILEWMSEQGGGDAAPRELERYESIRVSKPHIVRRLQALEKRGFVEKEGRGRYVMTEVGEKYLAGEIDAEVCPLDDDQQQLS